MTVCLTGCSKKFDYGQTGKVSGTLTCDGQTLPAGHAVVFMEPLKGFLAFGLTDEAGRFSVDSWNAGELPVGTYHVQIAPPAGKSPSAKEKKEDSFEKAAERPVREKARFHKRYESHITSKLVQNVAPGANDVKIEISSK